MTAYNSPAGTTAAPYTDLFTATSPGQGVQNSLTAVYPYSVPESGQQWPRPY